MSLAPLGSLDTDKTDRDEEEILHELRRIARLVQFARASAFDLGEHEICSKLVEVEDALTMRITYRR